MKTSISQTSAIASAMARLAADPASGDRCSAVVVVFADGDDLDIEDVIDVVRGIATVLGYFPADATFDATEGQSEAPWQRLASMVSNPLVIAADVDAPFDPVSLKASVSAARREGISQAAVVVVTRASADLDRTIEAVVEGVFDAGLENVETVNI